MKKAGRPIGATAKHDINITSEICNIIEKKKRFMHQREIANELIKKAKVNGEDEVKDLRRTTSVIIQHLKRSKRVAQYAASLSTRERYYGLPKWLKHKKPVAGTSPKKVKV